MREAGCVYVTDVDRPIVDSLVMRRVLAYAERPRRCWSRTGRPIPGSPPAPPPPRASSPAAWACPPRRPLAETDHAGARRGPGRADRRAAAGGPGQLRRRAGEPGPRPRTAALPVSATASINHLTLQRTGHRRLPHLLQAGAAACAPRTTARR